MGAGDRSMGDGQKIQQVSTYNTWGLSMYRWVTGDWLGTSYGLQEIIQLCSIFVADKGMGNKESLLKSMEATLHAGHINP